MSGGPIGLIPPLVEGQGSKLLATLLLVCCQAGFHRPIGLSSLQSNLSTPEPKTVTAVTMGLGALRMAGTCQGVGVSAPWKTYTLPSLFFLLVP